MPFTTAIERLLLSIFRIKQDWARKGAFTNYVILILLISDTPPTVRKNLLYRFSFSFSPFPLLSFLLFSHSSLFLFPSPLSLFSQTTGRERPDPPPFEGLRNLWMLPNVRNFANKVSMSIKKFLDHLLPVLIQCFLLFSGNIIFPNMAVEFLRFLLVSCRRKFYTFHDILHRFLSFPDLTRAISSNNVFGIPCYFKQQFHIIFFKFQKFSQFGSHFQNIKYEDIRKITFECGKQNTVLAPLHPQPL